MPAAGEALTREQALTAYTAGAAYAEGQELRKGRVAPGLAADLAVLSHCAKIAQRHHKISHRTAPTGFGLPSGAGRYDGWAT